MAYRPTKRTAGERRYRALKRQVEAAIRDIYWAQQHIVDTNEKMNGANMPLLMQYITQAKDALKK